VAVNESGLEIIAVKIDGKVCRTYEGLPGTFAGFAYCCLDKKVLPGFYQKGLVENAESGDRKLILSLSGNHSQAELTEILDIALLNMVAFPHAGSEADYFIESESNKKGR
jgi:hypothetical protein